MTIRDILAKVAKGETLTDEEKALAGGYDPDSAVNSAAAAARKKSEAEAEKARKDLEDLQKRLGDAEARLQDAAGKGKTDLEKLTAQVATLTNQVQAAQAEKAKLIRQQKLDDVIRQSGIQFVSEVDGSIMRGALVNEFAGLADEDLADGAKVKPVIDTFRARNKAVILDASGHGAGAGPHRPGASADERAKAIEAMTPEQRREDLKKRGIL